MKTLTLILGLIIGTAMGVNTQAQTQTRSQNTTQATTHQQAQPQSQPQSQTKSMIKIAELLKPIQDNLATQFKGWTPVQAYRLDTKGVISYEVLVKKDADEMRLFYDSVGKFLRQEQVMTMKSETKKESTPAKQETKTTQQQQPANRPK